MAKVIYRNNININTSADTKQHAIFRRMKRNGQWVGLTPQGYLSARDESGKAILVRDPERFDFITSMLKAIINGTCTIYDVKRAFDAVYTTPKYEHNGGRKVNSIRKLKRILLNPAYAGLVADVDDPTVFHKGRHEAMISYEEWWDLRRRLGE